MQLPQCAPPCLVGPHNWNQLTDIVGKETYTFTDRGGRSLTLRPEGTAGAVRAVIEGGLRILARHRARAAA